MATTTTTQPLTSARQGAANLERLADTTLERSMTVTEISSSNPAAAPLSIGRVALNVRDLSAMTAFYRDIIGLELVKSETDGAVLGAGGKPLIELHTNAAAYRDDPREAGLFHTAFLLPSRRELGRWLAHAARLAYPLDGAGDHLVSEAFYLSDPEGNGVEVYADRDPSMWRWTDGQVAMDTRPVDVDGLMAGIDRDHLNWTGAADGTTIGHVHLRVGDITAAERFYRDELGFERVSAMQGASFISTGHYHHHVGMNVWHSAGSTGRAKDRTGLAWFEVLDSRPGAKTSMCTDPSGIEVRVTPSA